MRITILYSENDGCDYHRLLQPSKFLAEEGAIIKTVMHKDCYKDETIFDCDIVLLKNMIFQEWGVMNALRNKYRFKIVLDIDDYYILPYNHLYYKTWNKAKIGERLVEACKNADLVFVTNELLRGVYKEYNKNIFIIPNAVPFDEPPFLSEKEQSDKTRFIYVAGSTHYEDLKLLSGLFQRLKSDGDFKNNGNFTLCGYNNPNEDKINIWYKMEAFGKSTGSYTRRHSLPLGYYIRHYNHGDVAIAPLEDTFFNNCKSNLKFLEAAAMKKPFICSNVQPFTIDKENKGIMFCDKTQDWYKSFKFFINNPNAIEEYGEINYEYGKKNYNLSKVNKERVEIFNNLVH